jgi:hypothetical protein
MTDAPTHIVDTAGARRTRCGRTDKRGPAMPYVLVTFVQAHIDGHARVGKAFTLCPDCAEGGW